MLPCLLGTLLGLAPLGSAGAGGAATSPRKNPGKAATPAMHADPATLTQLASFLHDYRSALASGDPRFLTEHTTFPLPFAEGVYEMEAKAKSGKVVSVEELLKHKETLLWPEVLQAKDGAQLAKLRRGAQKCGDTKSPEIPDWSQGGPAVELRGDEATLTYLSNPCESETHTVTLHFARSAQTWRLRERSVRMGAH